MALRTLHLCAFQFKDADLRVVAAELDGGTAINGTSEVIQTDGGGYWQADYTNGSFGGRQSDRRDLTLAWRAINAGLTGGTPAIVRFCDIHHQPVIAGLSVPHSDDTPFSDDAEYASEGADATVLAVVNGQAGGLNCTILDIDFAGGKPLIGGERFTHVHPTWDARAYEISDVTDIEGGQRIKFIPPIRGGILVGDPLDFTDVRCIMRRASPATNALNLGLYSTASISFVEYMVDPEP